MGALNTHTLDTLEFTFASWAPKFSKFPTSNVAAHFFNGDAYAYLINSASSLTILGQSAVMDFGGGPSDIVQKNMPAEILSNFPSTYLTTFTNNFTTDGTFFFGVDPGLGFTIDSVRQKSIVSKKSNVDAWGSITTPLGTFPSLRYFEVKNHTDSTWIYSTMIGGWNFFQETIDSSKQYSWWANGVGFPLVTANLDQASMALKSVDWLKATPTAGINELASAISVNTYPNPAQNEINFGTDASKVSAIQVFDITGRLVQSFAVNADNSRINTSDLANGEYSYSVLGKDKVVLNHGKFTIAK
jgi:hypothetical protein